MRVFPKGQEEEVLKSLREAVKVSLKTKMYQEKFSGAKKEINSFEDFEALPFTTREELLKWPWNDRIAVPLDKVERIYSSSGRPPKNLLVAFTKNDTYVKSNINASRKLGIPSGGLMLNLIPEGWAGGGMLIDHFAALCNYSIVSPPTHMLKDFLPQILKNFRFTAITTLPTKLAQLAAKLKMMKIDPRSLGVKALLILGEAASDYLIDYLRRSFDAQVYNYFGLTETSGIGYGIGGEMFVCDGTYLEIIDGGAVMTTTGKEASPVVRYKTEDRVDVRYHENGIPLIKSRGRVNDRVGERDLYAVDVENVIFQTADDVIKYCLVIKDGNLIVQAEEIDERLAEEIKDKVSQLTELKVTVTPMDVGSIPESPGKYRRLVRE